MCSHKLNIETGWYGSKSGSILNRACNFCCHLPTLELLLQLPEANPIIEDEVHFLGSCSRYQTMRASIKEPTKTLLLNGAYKTLFLEEHIGEFTKFLTQIFKTRFPAKKWWTFGSPSEVHNPHLQDERVGRNDFRRFYSHQNRTLSLGFFHWLADLRISIFDFWSVSYYTFFFLSCIDDLLNILTRHLEHYSR